MANKSMVVCVNSNCAGIFEESTKFCPYCATDQQKSEPKDVGVSSAKPAESLWEKVQHRAALSADILARPYSPNTNSEGKTSEQVWEEMQEQYTQATSKSSGKYDWDGVLLLRASEHVWDFEEDEIYVDPGERRPLLVVDEHIVHLSHTDKYLTMDELAGRVRNLIVKLEVPVVVSVETTCWQGKIEQRRRRIITSLAQGYGHQDIKVILGVDYLGKWASIHMDIAVQPDPFPVLPPPSKEPTAQPNWFAVGSLVIAVLGSFIYYRKITTGYSTLNEQIWFLLWIIMVVISIVWISVSLNRQKSRIEQEKMNQKFISMQEVQRQREERARERLSRTFRTDDIRLFASAMKSVFQFVVDDIVQSGAKIERIEGGKGGFFSEAGVTVAEPAPRTSNASDMDI
jgi:hypothetical protein